MDGFRVKIIEPSIPADRLIYEGSHLEHAELAYFAILGEPHDTVRIVSLEQVYGEATSLRRLNFDAYADRLMAEWMKNKEVSSEIKRFWNAMKTFVYNTKTSSPLNPLKLSVVY